MLFQLQYVEGRRFSFALSTERGVYEITASGVKKRTSRNVIIKLARQRKIDVVIVWKLDRWGRSVSDVITSI